MAFKIGRKLKKAVKKIKKTSKNPFRLLLFILLVLILCWSIYPLKYHLEQKKKNSALEREIIKLKKENKVFKEELIRLKSPEYVESIAREELGLIKPGEETYLVITAKEESQEETGQVGKEEKALENDYSFLQKIVSYFRELFK